MSQQVNKKTKKNHLALVSSVQAPATLALPKDGFLVESAVLRFFPVGRTTWWRGIREGSYPRPYRLSVRRVAWRAEDIRELIEKTSPVSVTS